MPHLTIKIITSFPELFPGPLEKSVIGNALKSNLWKLDVINIRDFAKDKHRTIDSPPVGGGGGMLMKPDVLSEAIDFTNKDWKNEDYYLFYLSPRGSVFNQKMSQKLSKLKNIILICGRFEGIDQRVIDYYDIKEISIGDYVLTGGEIAAYAVIDSCVRLIPGVIGNKSSIKEESFSVGSEYENLLEYPQYTKPIQWMDRNVPDILLRGDHAKIKAWRLDTAKKLTKKLRPDL